VNQKQRGVEQERHGVNLALEAMDIQLRTAGIKMTASDRVAKLAENEANYQQKIAQALRDQDSAMANRLSKEKAMKALQIEADELLKTPKQKADEAKEQRKKNKALDIAIARKKVRDESAAREKAKFIADNAMRVAHGFAPLPMPAHFGPVRAGDALGEATRKKLEDAANREAIPIKPGEKKADVMEMKVVNLIVKALKSD
jgi:HD superfamily phosphohydrolase